MLDVQKIEEIKIKKFDVSVIHNICVVMAIYVKPCNEKPFFVNNIKSFVEDSNEDMKVS